MADKRSKPKKASKIRHGFGRYTFGGDRSDTVKASMRRSFLQLIQSRSGCRWVPQGLEERCSEAYKSWRLAVALKTARTLVGQEESQHGDDSAEKLEGLEAAIRQWGDTTNLIRDGRGEWLVHVAKETLRMWDMADEPEHHARRTDLGIGPYRGRVFAPITTVYESTCYRFEFPADGWAPTDETEAAFRARMRQSFETTLDEFVTLARDRIADQGAVKSPTRRETHQHLEWLVRLQFESASYVEIASLPGQQVTDRAVEKAVSRARRDLDLPSLPPIKPSRAKERQAGSL